MSSQQSKLVSTLVDEQHVVFQYVITVCDNAAQQCPAFPGRAKVQRFALFVSARERLHCVKWGHSYSCGAAHLFLCL